MKERMVQESMKEWNVDGRPTRTQSDTRGQAMVESIEGGAMEDSDEPLEVEHKAQAENRWD